MFTSFCDIPEHSFATAATTAIIFSRRDEDSASRAIKTPESGQSTQASRTNSKSLDGIVKVATVVQQITTAQMGCVIRRKRNTKR
jgi:hypothetical protein